MKRHARHHRFPLHRGRHHRIAKAIGLAGGIAALGAMAVHRRIQPKPGHRIVRAEIASAHGMVKQTAGALYSRHVHRIASNLAFNAKLHAQKIHKSAHGLALEAGSRLRSHMQLRRE